MYVLVVHTYIAYGILLGIVICRLLVDKDNKGRYEQLELSHLDICIYGWPSVICIFHQW